MRLGRYGLLNEKNVRPKLPQQREGTNVPLQMNVDVVLRDGGRSEAHDLFVQ